METIKGNYKYRLVSVKYRLNLTKLTKIENGINRYLADT